MEKHTNFFMECHSTAGWHGKVAGDAEALVVTTTTPLSVDPAFGGAVYQETTGETLYNFLHLPMKELLHQIMG